MYYYFIVFLLFLFLFLKIYKYAVKTYWLSKIPGPPMHHLFFGNMAMYNKSKAEIFNEINELGTTFFPIYRSTSCLLFSSAHLLCPDDYESILSNVKHNEKSEVYDLLHNWLKTGLLTSGGAKWHLRRKILTPAFHFSILKSFISIFNEETENFIETLKSECHKPLIEITPILSQFTLKTIGQTSLGTKFNFKTKKEKQYKEAIHKISTILMYRLFRPWFFLNFTFMFHKSFYPQRKLLKTLHNFTKEVIKNREIEFNENSDINKPKRLALLDTLFAAKAEGKINDEGIREEVDTFLFEGHDTTATALSFILMLIACHKDIQEQIYQEMVEVLGDVTKKPDYNDLQNLKYLERCIKEALRLYPSVFFISRSLGEDFTTSSGYKLKKSSRAFLYIYHLHHNAKFWPNPEKFDPDRFLPENTKGRHPFAYLPFSAGPRNCIGQKFALLELKSLVCGVLTHYKLEPVDTPESIVLMADIVLRTEENIKVKFVKRNQ